MDEKDYYYRDIVDAISDADSEDHSSDEDENVAKRKMFVDFAKHMTAEEFKIFMQYEEDTTETLMPDSNDYFERKMANEAENNVNEIHVDPETIHQENDDNDDRAMVISSTANQKKDDNVDQTELNPIQQRIQKTEKQIEEENDELFYDPDEDDSNQRWMDQQTIQSSSTSSTTIVNEQERKLMASARLKKPKSDATLNCPGCLTLLCLDCQRHSIYKTQYRAMFVMNCRIDYQKQLIYKSKNFKKIKFQRRSRRQSNRKDDIAEQDHHQDTVENQADENMDEEEATTAQNKSDLYYPVHCTECNTQVAVYDMDEVYHFFSVIASH